MTQSQTVGRRTFELQYSAMIRALNKVHYAGETGFYSTAALRACEEHLFARYGRSARILDVGCGAGRVTRALTERGASIVGVDVNLAAIEVARQHCPGAEFVHASMTDLPLPDESFDQVWCLRFSFNALPTEAERLDTLRELWRVCALGGIILIEAFNWYHLGRLGLVRAANLLEQLSRNLRWHGDRGRRSVPIPARDILYLANKAGDAAPGYAHLTTVRELRQLAVSAGLASHVTITSEASLTADRPRGLRPRHGSYSMWLVATKPVAST